MIAAALHGVLAARADAGRSAWHSLGAWRMLGGAVGSGSTQVLLEDDGLRVNEATVWPMDERWRVRIAGVEQEFSATLAGNTLEVGRDGVTVRYTVAVEKHAVDGERLWLTGAGRTRTWRRLDRWQRALKGGAAAEERGGNRLLAPMPGMVTQVHVGVGAAVRAADILVQMEAMKMVHTLSAPAAGRVSELRCRVGDAVRGGDVLVVMESEEKQ